LGSLWEVGKKAFFVPLLQNRQKSINIITNIDIIFMNKLKNLLFSKDIFPKIIEINKRYPHT